MDAGEEGGMNDHRPCCPRCESRECALCDVLLQTADERFRATHECDKCSTRFKFTPPARPAPKEDTCPVS